VSDVESLGMQDQPELDTQLPGFPGHILREAREGLSLSQKEAARELHLTSKVINAIEEDDFTLIPSSVFARGYIRSYARHVGLDGQALVNAFDEAYGMPNNVAKPMTAIRKFGSQSKPSDTWVKLFSIVFVIGLLVASVVWWQSQNSAFVPLQPNDTGMEVQEDSLDLSMLVTNQDEVDSVVLDEQAQTAIDLGLQIEADAVTPVVDDAIEIVKDQDALVITKPVVATGVVELALDQAQLIMVFDKDCWVEIKDGNGKMILSDLYSAGDTIEQVVTAPIEVLLGRSSGVGKLSFDGQLIDLKPHTRKDIARLTLSK